MKRTIRAWRRSGAAITLALTLAGCLVGPDYKRPETGPPTQFRFASDAPERESLADLKWFELFQDDALRALIQTALQQNYDLEIAAARVLQAQAQVGIVRSEIFPTIVGGGSGQTRRIAQNASSGLPPGVNPVVTYGTLSLGLTWEIDVWGRIRRLTEASRAELRSSEDTQRAVLITVIAAVATSYFQLRALDLQLEISHRTIEARERGLRLTRTQRDLGSGTGLDVAQAEDLLYSARATLRDVERQIAQTEDTLSLLLGRNPGDIIRGRGIDATVQNLPSIIPAGLPSA